MTASTGDAVRFTKFGCDDDVHDALNVPTAVAMYSAESFGNDLFFGVAALSNSKSTVFVVAKNAMSV